MVQKWLLVSVCDFFEYEPQAPTHRRMPGAVVTQPFPRSDHRRTLSAKVRINRWLWRLHPQSGEQAPGKAALATRQHQ